MPDLRFMAPDANCNARLYRGTGYCDLPAGRGTDHPGHGRCRLHGGMAGSNQDGVDGPLDLFNALGLSRIIELAETMTHDDQEYLMEVGTNALVVTRSGILARLQNKDNSPKEMADLTIALTRIEALIAKHPDDENPDAAPNEPSTADEELARIADLEESVRATK